MSELAFNANGESFEIPAAVTAWRVRRMKPRGAPELVYGADGRPLTLPIESEIDDLRAAVGATGKYRLDPINDDGKCVENVPPAYVHVVKADHVESTVIATSTGHHDSDTVREAMRMNTELAKSVIDRFPEMMHAAAELLRAADGAGLPSRKPRFVDASEDSEDEIEVDAVTVAPAGFDLNALVAQLVPMLVTGLMSGKMKVPGLAAMFDWRKAQTLPQAQDIAPEPIKKAARIATPEVPQPEELPPLDASAMAHVVAIQSALQPSEVAYVQEVAKELSPADLRAWFDKLSKLSVPDAVETIRGLIAGKAGGES